MSDSIAMLKDAIERFKAALAAVEAECNVAAQHGIVGPNLTVDLVMVNLNLAFVHFSRVAATTHFMSEYNETYFVEVAVVRLCAKMIETVVLMAMALMDDAVNPTAAEAAPVGPVVADVSEKHNITASEETADHITIDYINLLKLKDGVVTLKAAFAAVEAEYNLAAQHGIVRPKNDVDLVIMNFNDVYGHFVWLATKSHFVSVTVAITHFTLVAVRWHLARMIEGLLVLAFLNVDAVDPAAAELATIGPAVDDMSVEHHTGAPEETVEHKTAVPDETVEHNQNQPDPDPNKEA